MSSEPQQPTAASAPQPATEPAPQPAPPRARGFIWTALWTLAGAIFGIGVGAGVLEGTLLPARDTSDTMRLGIQVTELLGRVETLTRDLQVKDKEVASERDALATSRAEIRAANLRSDFLGSLLVHERVRTDASRKALAASVCSLLKQAQAARIAIISTPLQLRDEHIRAGMHPDVEALLLQNGVDPALLARARAVPAEVILPSQVTQFNVLQVQRAAQERRRVQRAAQEAIAAVQRRAQSISIAQTVRFADGTEHRISEDVALWMHSSTECRSG